MALDFKYVKQMGKFCATPKLQALSTGSQGHLRLKVDTALINLKGKPHKNLFQLATNVIKLLG